MLQQLVFNKFLTTQFPIFQLKVFLLFSFHSFLSLSIFFPSRLHIFHREFRAYKTVLLCLCTSSWTCLKITIIIIKASLLLLLLLFSRCLFKRFLASPERLIKRLMDISMFIKPVLHNRGQIDRGTDTLYRDEFVAMPRTINVPSPNPITMTRSNTGASSVHTYSIALFVHWFAFTYCTNLCRSFAGKFHRVHRLIPYTRWTINFLFATTTVTHNSSYPDRLICHLFFSFLFFSAFIDQQ